MAELFPLRPLQVTALDGLRSSLRKGEFYVYVIFRPDGSPCYVGKGKGRRWQKHLWRSHNPHLASIVKQAGGCLPIVKIHEQILEAEALEIEKVFIKAIGREVDGGPLVNLTEGGDGVSGYQWSDDDRARMSRTRKGELSPRYGKHMSDDAKARIREARTGSVASEQTKEKMRTKQKGKKHSPEARAKMSASQSGARHAMFGRHHSTESKAKISAAFLLKRLNRSMSLFEAVST